MTLYSSLENLLMKSGHALEKIVLFMVASLIGAGEIACGADIVGVITLKGTPPAEKEITPLMENPDCAKMHTTTPTTHFYVVGTKGELADVVVSFKGVTGKSTGASAPPVVLDQKGCLYTPQILAIQTGQKLIVRNSDPCIHNVHATPTMPGFHRCVSQFIVDQGFSWEGVMCRERKVYTMSSDPYCSVIKQHFDAAGIHYKEVDIGRNAAGFFELILFYGKGPLPVIVEDGRIIPVSQVIQNAHMTF